MRARVSPRALRFCVYARTRLASHCSERSYPSISALSQIAGRREATLPRHDRVRCAVSPSDATRSALAVTRPRACRCRQTASCSRATKTAGSTRRRRCSSCTAPPRRATATRSVARARAATAARARAARRAAVSGVSRAAASVRHRHAGRLQVAAAAAAAAACERRDRSPRPRRVDDATTCHPLAAASLPASPPLARCLCARTRSISLPSQATSRRFSLLTSRALPACAQDARKLLRIDDNTRRPPSFGVQLTLASMK